LFFSSFFQREERKIEYILVCGLLNFLSRKVFSFVAKKAGLKDNNKFETTKLGRFNFKIQREATVFCPT
jgi:hypothetical protein